MRRIVEIPGTEQPSKEVLIKRQRPKSRKCESCNRYKISAIPMRNPYTGVKAVLCTFCGADSITSARLARAKETPHAVVR